MAKDDPTIQLSAELMNTPADVKALLDYGAAQMVHPPIANPDGSFMHFVGKDVRTQTVPALNPALPDFVTVAEVVVEPKSFTDYIIAFKSNDAICRASLGKNEIVAVLDYHGQARKDPADASGLAKPNRLAHTVTLQCPFDRDYAKWRAVFGGKKFDQRELAELIEDLIHTIHEPAAADLLEMIADLKVDRQIKFKSARNERNGNVQFTYEEVDVPGSSATASAVTGAVSLPEKIAIVTPIFQGGPATLLEAKLRYRMDKGVVAFTIAVPGLVNVEREAFRSIGEHVRQDTGTPVYYVA